jgi:ABC-2 type transport system permease protein
MGMWAIAVKEFRELRRDRRTLAMMIVLPLLLLIVFGYAASFDVKSVPTVVEGPAAWSAASRLPAMFHVVEVSPTGTVQDATAALRDGRAQAAVVAASPPATTQVLADGSQLFSARAVLIATSRVPGVRARVLFNPGLKTAVVMVPGIVGIILVFVGTLATALGVVRERQMGTLEQLAVMPFTARDVFFGKVAPYFVVAALDMGVIVAAGVGLFGVPFRGSFGTFLLASVLFLFVTLGLGVLISTVSENQGQAIQLAIMTLLPQVLLSGLVFPVSSMAAGVRWIAYVLPLTYFIRIARGVMVKATPIGALWFPLLMLAALGAAVFGLSLIRFRRDLAPAGPAEREGATTVRS